MHKRSPIQSGIFQLIIILGMVLVPAKIQGQEPALFRVAGFATVNGSTTGGAGGDSVVVHTGIELQEAINGASDNMQPRVILVEGVISPANSGSLSKIDVKDVNDLTIIGAGPGADFNGIGLKIRRASNIILRNLKVHYVLTGEKDCIGIEGPADHIWVDHCELYNEFQGVDKDYYDGLLDAKADCEYITYSWNYLHDSWKTALVGSSEGDDFDRKLTMHHNYFRNCNSRIPLFRGGKGHFFNNYYVDIASTAINSRINACVLIENNWFSNTKNPWVTAYSDVFGSGEVSGNHLDSSWFEYSDDTHELPECSPLIPYVYDDILQDAAEVPGLVMAYAGVGKLDADTITGYRKYSGPANPFLQVGPNPVSGTGIITYAASDHGAIRISLTGLTGRRWVLLEGTARDGSPAEIVFDGRDFAPGIYLVEFESGTGRAYSKIIITR